MDLEKIYGQFNGDLSTTLGRLGGSTSLLERLLKKFLDDKNMDALNAGMANHDCQEAFKAVHTMKGMALNLGFTELAAASSALTEKLRGGEMDGSDDLYQKTKEAYSAVIDAINS